jgi:hypothetical protein
VKSDLPNKVVKAIRRDVDSRQWPIALKSYIDPRVKSLEEKLDQNVFAALKGPWTIRCNLCGSEADYELDTYCIESLLINRAIHVNCANPGCWNHGPILAVGIKLSELLTAHLTKGQLS